MDLSPPGQEACVRFICHCIFRTVQRAKHFDVREFEENSVNTKWMNKWSQIWWSLRIVWLIIRRRRGAWFWHFLCDHQWVRENLWASISPSAKWLAFTECLPWAVHCAKGIFIDISLNLLRAPWDTYYHYPHFMHDETENQLDNLPQISKLGNGRTGIWTKALLSQTPHS